MTLNAETNTEVVVEENDFFLVEEERRIVRLEQVFHQLQAYQKAEKEDRAMIKALEKERDRLFSDLARMKRGEYPVDPRDQTPIEDYVLDPDYH